MSRVLLKDKDDVTLYREDGSNVKFHIKAHIGSGASCVVYHAVCEDKIEHLLKEYNPRNLDLERTEAGVLIVPEHKQELFDNGLKRFRNGNERQKEIRLLEHLKNSTSNVQGYFYGNGTEYIDMTVFSGQTYNHIESETLHSLMLRMRELAQAIGNYHDAGFLHLDIKPDNIFVLDEKQSVKGIMLFDFDSVIEKSNKMIIPAISYTKDWAAPEQLLPYKRNSICEATDLFSIGEIIFTKIFGRHSTQTERRSFAEYDIDYNADIFKNVSPKVVPLIKELFRHTLCAVPTKRYQTAEELIDLLDEIIPLSYCTYNSLLTIKRNDYQMKLQHYVEDNPYKKGRQNFLYEVICEINGIGEDVYKDEQKKTRILEISEFEQKSLLEWTKKDKYDCTSYLFRCRFLTVFLSEFLKKSDNIIVNRSSYMYSDQTEKFDATHGDILQIYDDMQYFIKNVLSERSHANIIHKINQYCNYKKLSDNPAEVNNCIKDLILELKNGLKKSIRNQRELLDADAISKIYRLAFLICTGKNSTLESTKFQIPQKINITCELRSFTELLGKSIVESCEYVDRPLLYLAYNKASPSIMSKYKDINTNKFISVGARALEYTKFYCNDKYITNFIDKML